MDAPPDTVLLHRLKPPLRWAAAGLAILIVDLPIRGVDIVPDMIGGLILLWAMWRFLRLAQGSPAMLSMSVAALAAAVSQVEIVARDLLAYTPPLPVTQSLGVAASLGAAAFCLGMRDLCDPTRAWFVARSWQRTAVYIGAIYVGLGLLTLAHRLWAGPASTTRIPGAGSPLVILIFLGLLLAPAAHFIVSTIRTLVAEVGPIHPCRRCGRNRIGAADNEPCPHCAAPGYCRGCGYDLSGLAGTDRCPECGHGVSPGQNESPRPFDRGLVQSR